jgi:hypothetical protein
VRRGLVAGVVVVAVAAAATIGYFVFKPEPFKVADYDQMCESPRGFPEAAAYDGPALHPVALVNGGMSMTADDPEIRVWIPHDPATVQLVACVTRIGRGSFVKRCEYTAQNSSGGAVYKIDLYRGTHTIAVYAARSGEKLGESRVEGEGFVGNSMKEDSDPCQSFLRTDATGRSEQEGRPSDSQLRAVLDPYVRRTG